MAGPRTQLSTPKKTPYKIWLQSGDWYDYPPRWEGDLVVQFVEGNLRTTEGHQFSKLGKTSEDIGGDFAVSKKEYSEFSSMGDSPLHFSEEHVYGEDPDITNPMAHGITHHYWMPKAVKGNVSEANFWESWETEFAPSSPFVLDGLGTTGISRIIPTSPVFSAASFIGELREGVPKFGIESWKDRTHLARSAGKDYLNYEFGWKPLVSDIKNFARTVRNAHAITKEYEDNSGKLLHRRYDWPTEFETYFEEWTGKYPDPALSLALYRSDHIGRLRSYGKIKRRRWLKAAFTYYLPPVGSNARDLALANHLYGINLTPDTVWELTPWSWAADWVTNIGDIATNISAFATDGLVMPHAYIMEETSLEVKYILDGVAFKSYPGMQTFSQTFKETSKVRRRATPFGFGINSDTFTDRQIAIITALGLSKH